MSHGVLDGVLLVATAAVAMKEYGQNIHRRAHTDGSYLSANDPRVHFGLGDDAAIDSVVVKWPNGNRETWQDIGADRFVTLVEGSGSPSIEPQ